MHRSRLAALVIDSQREEKSSAIDFWAGALGWPGHETDEKYGKLATPSDQPDVLIQQVDHPSRVHLDIETDDIDAEVARLEKLGATVVERLERWTVMEAPTGHRFCVVHPQRSDFDDADSVNVWP
ncbi:glyoxalase [Salinicola sp. MH3R3-1]|uniref:VOC family protein n=1 Tax=Salinicola sp. MH3R3-1 TaxID=1928762 RepID=UPI00094E99AE|nr:VOC family protein [Salinicola sp. MH3R3-1]OLO07584.1 glyoxalase [Salinicola sp. MH3R3-1]